MSRPEPQWHEVFNAPDVKTLPAAATHVRLAKGPFAAQALRELARRPGLLALECDAEVSDLQLRAFPQPAALKQLTLQGGTITDATAVAISSTFPGAGGTGSLGRPLRPVRRRLSPPSADSADSVRSISAHRKN